MSLVHFCNQPVSSFEDLFNNEFYKAFVPAIDITESKDNYVIKADLPGVVKEDVHLSFDNGILTLEGERKTEKEDKEKNYHRIERSYGRFVRSFNLGAGVNANSIQANYKDGVLEVTVPKAEIAKPKAIDIKVV